MEALDLRVFLLTVPWQQGRELVDYDPRGQSIVHRCAVNLLALPLDPTDFFVERPGPILESVTTSQTLSIKLGVVPPGGGSILSFILRRPRVILPASMPFLGCLVGLTSQLSRSCDLHFGCSSNLFYSLVGGGRSPCSTMKTSRPPSEPDSDDGLYIGSAALGQHISWWST
jgi:hypothetical protein